MIKLPKEPQAHHGRKTVAVATKAEAAAEAKRIADEAEANKPPTVNPNEMPGADGKIPNAIKKPAPVAIKKPVITKALKGLKVKRK